MKMKSPCFLPLLAALALCGCESVTSKTPVGDKVPPMDPKAWNGKWRYGGDKLVATTKVLDAKRGLVEMVIYTPWTKPGTDEVQTGEVLVRMLGPEMVGNELDNGSYGFERIAMMGDCIVTFAPDKEEFAKLIKQHKIAGKIERDPKGKPTGNCEIKGLSSNDYERLKAEGIDVRSLFEENPSRVFVRSHGLW